MIDWFILALFSPIIFGVPAIIYPVGRWLKILPGGAAMTPMFLLLVCAGAAGLSLVVLVDATITRPAQVQTTYLGRPYVGVFALRGYDADIGGEWRYALSPDIRAALRARCVAHERKPIEQYIDLYQRTEGRTSTHLWIEDGQLHMVVP